MVQDIDISHTIWVNNIAALKGKATRNKPIHLAGEIVKIPKELVKLHKELWQQTYSLYMEYYFYFVELEYYLHCGETSRR